MAETDTDKAVISQEQSKLEKLQRENARLLKYNEELRIQVEDLNRQLHQYRKSAKNKRDLGIQVDENELRSLGMEITPKWTTNDDTENQMSIADSLKAAAEEAVSQTGYVYDENSGMYYDCNSGYYYDNERSLYYEPTQGIYYYYNEETQQYEVHSQIDLSQYYPQYTSHEAKTASQSNKRNDCPKHGNQQDTKTRKRKRTTRSSSKSRNVSLNAEIDINHIPSIMENNCDDENIDVMSNKKSELFENVDINNERNYINRDSKVIEVSCILKKIVEIINLNLEHQKSSAVSTKDQFKRYNGLSNGLCVESGEITDLVDGDSDSGELTDSDDTSESDDTLMCTCDTSVKEELNPLYYPPCIRAIVQSSDTLDCGNLYIITYHGGTIGTGTSCTICLPSEDDLIQQEHVRVLYDVDTKAYSIQSCGHNCTFSHNGAAVSKPQKLSQNDTISIGSTTFLIHIHLGTETCDECEPGQVIAKIQKEHPKHVIIESKEDKLKEMKRQKKKLIKKYGLAKDIYNPPTKFDDKYQDRAADRRRNIGSELASEPECTSVPSASVLQPISSENKGRKMLEKLGWSEGTSLGKTGTGLTEPVQVNMRLDQRQGLGANANYTVTIDDPNSQSKKVIQRRLKAQQRFNKLEQTTDTQDITLTNTEHLESAVLRKDQLKSS